MPEYTGKMNFYLAAVDDMLKHPTDNPSIGLILCKTKKKLVVEYALRHTTTPMGIAEFRYLEKLPEELKGSLPTIEEIEAELASPKGYAIEVNMPASVLPYSQQWRERYSAKRYLEYQSLADLAKRYQDLLRNVLILVQTHKFWLHCHNGVE